MQSLMLEVHLTNAKVQARGTEKPTEQFCQDSSGQPPTISQENHLSSEVGYLLPPSIPTPLTMYEDDVYMGDNEADIFGEERRIKKDMRNWKGKARQVEDEDEGIENSNNSELDIAQQLKDKGIDEGENNFDDRNLSDINGDINFDKDDEVFEADVVRPYYT